ncbi:type VI secretion system protein ImpA [Pseudomonas sp. SJZ079]|uniref:type VI secretion system protein TssA n=1 Tax=Pseudomonas sp. SJZ079 TaxID=2572887 RepID=UPI00119C37CA|nr:type VI secretion system protein TssA [Pseudomonas sp. SJZ079]TWC40128.1 type VI secretion system protein ImpA [Pseudomonas sp. SJZ079]
MDAVALQTAGLLEPISGPQPCGSNIRHQPEYDALREARREDDESLPTGVWSSDLKRADWAVVERLASETLSRKSKDMMVAAWLGEAWLHRHGFAGLAEALTLLANLCERFSDELHPQPEDGDLSWRSSPLEWLIRRYAEVLLTRVPLVGEVSQEFAKFSYADWQQLQRKLLNGSDHKSAKVERETAQATQRQLNDALRMLPGVQFRQNIIWLAESHDALARLEFWSDAQLAFDSPSFTPLRQTIEQLATLMQEFLAMHPATPPQPAIDESPFFTEEEGSSPTPATFGRAPSSRDEAYRQLELIASYLAKSEPHSPVPYLINRAVEWGQKPLRDLLAELISADAEARRLWTLLGVLP